MEQKLSELLEALLKRQESAERQLGELREAVNALQLRLAETIGTAAPQNATAAAAADAGQPAPQKPRKPEVTHEILVMLAAAATAYLGKKVRIRSAKMLQSPYEIINPWAQQGRVFIQASHVQHLRLR